MSVAAVAVRGPASRSEISPHEASGADGIDLHPGTSDLNGARDHEIEPALGPALVREDGPGANLDLFGQRGDPPSSSAASPANSGMPREEIDLDPSSAALDSYLGSQILPESVYGVMPELVRDPLARRSPLNWDLFGKDGLAAAGAPGGLEPPTQALGRPRSVH